MAEINEIKLGEKDELIASIELLRRQLPHLMEHVKVIAELRKASYDALIAEGFDKAQALELCKSMEL